MLNYLLLINSYTTNQFIPFCCQPVFVFQKEDNLKMFI